MYPNRQQQSVLLQYLGAYRFTYNHALAYYNNSESRRFNLKHMRSQFVNLNSPFVLQHTWLSEVQYDFRDEAIKDLQKNIKSAYALLKSGHIKHFELSYKRRKRSDQSFSLLHKNWNRKRGMLSQTFSSEHMKFKGITSLDISKDTRILRDKLGKWWICVIMDVLRDESQVPNKDSIVAIDPGVRTFLTMYDPNGFAYEFGRYDIKRIENLCFHMDRLLSKINNLPPEKMKRKWNMTKASYRIRNRISNLVTEVHRKASKFLCKSYKTILLPTFETSNMVSKKDGKRRLHSKTARNILTWSHYKFKTRLRSKAKEYGCNVVDCTEEYTSQTCTRCGYLQKIQGKTKKCPQCKTIVDRDIGAARNILMKFLCGT